MTTFDWSVIVVLAVLVGTAWFIENRYFRIGVVIVLLIVLLERDFSIGAYGRSLLTNMHDQGLWTEQFRDGAVAIVDYCASTRVTVLAVSVLLLILCIRGFKHAGTRHKQ